MPLPIKICGLFSDYDGTLALLDVKREDSRASAQTQAILKQIAQEIPVGIITTKDMSFILPRAPFATAWAAVGGLEIKFATGKLLDSEIGEETSAKMALARDFAARKMKNVGLIEDKKDSNGRVVAFCVDWRQHKDYAQAKQMVVEVESFCKSLQLELSTYDQQPFMDVLPYPVNKGLALKKLKIFFGLDSGILYLGDSETDNSAFAASDISVGVRHPSRKINLTCQYSIEFENLSLFLQALLHNCLLFSQDLPGINRYSNVRV